jgi:hypothetical protein
VDVTKFLVLFTLGNLAARLGGFAFFIRRNRFALFIANYNTSFNGLFFDKVNCTVLKNAAMSRREKNQIISQMIVLSERK